MKKENRYDLTGEMTDDYPFEVVWSAEHELIAGEESDLRSSFC